MLTEAERGVDVELFREWHHTIGLMIVDRTMPGMGGYRRIDEIDDRIIFFSGLSNEPDIVEMKEKGPNDFIIKPFRLSELSRLIVEVMAAK